LGDEGPDAAQEQPADAPPGAGEFCLAGRLGQPQGILPRALRSGRSVKARGILLLGVPGSGKSCFAKALGKETSRPTLLLDMGMLLGSLVGQSDANLRHALRIADAMAPCVLFCDEIEKALSGVGSQGGSGVATRLFGNLLTWLSDHDSDVFFIGTANDIARLPPEFVRAERFDGTFFVDLPQGKEKDTIWAMYRQLFAIPESQARPDDTDWTGAEVRSCCRLAALLAVPLTQAAHQVVPVAVTAAEAVVRLRSWASGRCLSASSPGIYRHGNVGSQPSRKIRRDPSSN
jgi:SpoVK/Ycf46/Vps4 family AAA+-type ATPase